MEPKISLDRRIHLVAGKGGVGRTTVARSIAVRLSQDGRKTLLAELEGDTEWASPLARPFGREGFSKSPEKIAENLYGMNVSAAEGQRLFLKSWLKVPGLPDAILLNQGVRSFLDGAPAFREMGWFYQVLVEARKDYDAIVLDLPATGHLIGLARLPDLLLGITSVGPIPDLFREGQRMIYNPVDSGAWIVTLPEVLPATEALELASELEGLKVPVQGILVNRSPMLPEPNSKLPPALKQNAVVQELLSEFSAIHILKESSHPVWLLPEVTQNQPIQALMEDAIRAS
jgi:arsenite/tail-anchored protein-transporting ATPase